MNARRILVSWALAVASLVLVACGSRAFLIRPGAQPSLRRVEGPRRDEDA
jgi:hypothetical protein